jgi:ribosome-associated heat shock protein Hsp15
MAIRIDKWLWAVRVYKTRSDATEACRTGRVGVNGSPAKPSKEVKAGDAVTVRKNPVTYTLRVLEPVQNRQPARNVPLYAENITPEEELMKLTTSRFAGFGVRERGAGRPTKKDRREVDELMEELFFDSDDEN